MKYQNPLGLNTKNNSCADDVVILITGKYKSTIADFIEREVKELLNRAYLVEFLIKILGHHNCVLPIDSTSFNLV